MTIETRTFSEIREVDEAEHAAHIRLVTYHRADTYGSTWLPGVFDESLTTGHVPGVWSHDRAQIIGSVREHDLQPGWVDVSLVFADLDAVPAARMAYSLMKDGHVRDTSFGFSRVKDGTIDRRSDPHFAPSQPGERERITKADLVEVSAVLKGSVPSNGVLAVRADPALTDVETDIAALILTRAPHAYRPSSGDGSDCVHCGGPADATAHTVTRQTILDLATTPVRESDPHLLLRAADAAVDTALGLLAPEVLSVRATAALGLLMAADAALDRSQDLLTLVDADGEDGPVGALTRAFPAEAVATATVTEVEPREPDEVDTELDRLLSGNRGYGFRVTANTPPPQDDPPKA